MKCAICDAEIKVGLMGKIKGTYIREGKKLRPVCPSCQKEGEEGLRKRL